MVNRGEEGMRGRGEEANGRRGEPEKIALTVVSAIAPSPRVARLRLTPRHSPLRFIPLPLKPHLDLL